MNAPARLVTHHQPNLARLRGFIGDLADLIDGRGSDQRTFAAARALLARLIAHDDWLPDAFACPHAARYQQYLLHCDSRERFSVVAFVWGPGQATPIHDHHVWGLVGVLRGQERVEDFRRQSDGSLLADAPARLLVAGDVDVINPLHGDIHRVANGLPDSVSVSIHVYGGNIGAIARATYAPDGTPKRFISGYANDALPNLWDRSAAP